MNIYRTGKQYATEAKNEKYDKLKYSQCDCQSFIEKVLADIGVRRADGQPYNWRGSNQIARVACSWIGTKEEAIAKFGEIPIGAWAFVWDDKGGEKERGYTDGLGDYKHIGIYVGDNIVRDSTKTSRRDGVGNSDLNRYNRIGLCMYLDFGTKSDYNDHAGVVQIIAEIRDKLNELERMVINES